LIGALQNCTLKPCWEFRGPTLVVRTGDEAEISRGDIRVGAAELRRIYRVEQLGVELGSLASLSACGEPVSPQRA
jgi:hypothetical protein